MSPRSGRPDAFNHAVHTANIWLADVAAACGTTDRRYSHRVLRGWLHSLRDRLTVDTAVKFGAQLPELIRGIYYDGWDPSRVPIKFGSDEYVLRFSTEAGIPAADVPEIAISVTEALRQHMSAGQLEDAFAELPTNLRLFVSGEESELSTLGLGQFRQAATAGGGAGGGSGGGSVKRDQLVQVEEKLSTLTEAVRTLAHGLEDGQLTGVDMPRVSRAARLADEILLAAR